MTREILTSSRFYLELTLDGSTAPVDAYFLECRGFRRTQEIQELAQVTSGRWGQGARHGQLIRTKLPGAARSGNLTLRRGLTGSMALWQWFEAVEQGRWSSQQRNGSLTLYNQQAQPQARFEFRGAWPTSYVMADLSAQSSDYEIEELELAIDSLVRTL